MLLNSRSCALVAALGICGTVFADNPPAPGCGEARAYERSHRPTHFSIERGADSFEYRCTLRKSKYRKKDPAVFRRECESFVNEYIGILNRCENAGLSRFMLDESREQREKQESGKFLRYGGIIHIG